MPRDGRDRTVRDDHFGRKLALAAGAVVVLAICLAVRFYWDADSARAQNILQRLIGGASAEKEGPAAREAQAAPVAPQTPAGDEIMATVNNQPITRDELAQQCLRQYGVEVLESLINKHLIVEHCRRRNIVVDEAEIQQEIARMAERFGVGREEWLALLERERGISPRQYAEDLIWPTVALRKLAAAELTVTPAEIREAYEMRYGPAVQARLIALDDEATARRVHAEAVAEPAAFGDLAMKYSVDPNSASAKGRIQPIRKHMGEAQVEQAAFHLEPGAVSEIIPVGGQFVILQCEAHLPAREVPLAGKVQDLLVEAIRDKKLRQVGDQVFERLKQEAQVEVIYTDPAKRQAQPGVAASINGRPITMDLLAGECAKRHGEEVLEGLISRTILEQACRQQNITVSDEEITAEIARAARSMGRVTPDGRPDVQAWLKETTEEQEITVDLYIHDIVAPTVMLKKLVGEAIEVTEEDLRKGFESNYGPRVRCLAIVLDNQRRAQEVWNMARKQPTAAYFGDLAEQYSTDATTRVLRGEVPPIQRHGPRAVLEKEAFSLTPGELSAVIQVEDNWVILFCEGFTTPTEVTFAEVRDLLYQDLREKKLRLAMARKLHLLEESARVVNQLAGSSQKPAGSGTTPLQPRAVSPRLETPPRSR